MISCAVVTLVYVAVAVLAVSALSSDKLAESDAPLADIVRGALGGTGATLVIIAALFSTDHDDPLDEARRALGEGRGAQENQPTSVRVPDRHEPLGAEREREVDQELGLVERTVAPVVRLPGVAEALEVDQNDAAATLQRR
jgi:hypothetical protein